MSISPASQAVALRDCLQRLLLAAAETEWRGLCIIRCAPSITFKWPSHALTLHSDIATYRQYLGTSQSMLILDMREALHADALAATIPTLRAKGVAIVLLPPTPTPFTRRLVNALADSPLCKYLELPSPENKTDQKIDLSALPAAAMPEQTTPVTTVSALQKEQRIALSRLLQHVAHAKAAPALLNAPRGRGKSTLLGILARQLATQGDTVWLCAPSKRQAQTLLEAAGCSAMPLRSSAIQYIAADKLLAADAPPLSGQLIVDEAANLPRHMLDELVTRYPSAIMATTSEGYETCGRGFLLQFQQQLKEDFDSFLSLQLKQPIRFAANCPVEAWLHQSLLLKPTEPLPQIKQPRVQSDSVHALLSYSTLQAAALNDEALAICFGLLMDAHYQTSPNDLKLLLDDPSQTLVLQWQVLPDNPQKTLVGVVWLSLEGGLHAPLAEAVMHGTRRPAGNLLAQSLTRHTQCIRPACALWLRIVRIAVRSGLQQRGLGSALLQYVIANAGTQGCAGIGTSFASAAQINRFWGRHGFVPVRLGSRKDSITARYSLLMLQPLSASWAPDIKLWANYFSHELPAYQALFALSEAYVDSIESALGASSQGWAPTEDTSTGSAQRERLPYTQWAEHKIQAFAKGFLDLDSVRATLLSRYPKEVTATPLLSLAVQGSPLTHSDKKYYNLTGRKALTEKVRQICLQLPVKL